jgi:hypothetical protein
LIFLKTAIIFFILLESGNIAALYFFPDSKLANSVGVFKAWGRSKADPEVHELVKYLVNWVAGTKLIFIFLLGVLVYRGDPDSLIFTGAALVLSISTFFWRLFPQIRGMDERDQLEPKNYSRFLGWMILGILVALLGSIAAAVLI